MPVSTAVVPPPVPLDVPTSVVPSPPENESPPTSEVPTPPDPVPSEALPVPALAELASIIDGSVVPVVDTDAVVDPIDSPS